MTTTARAFKLEGLVLKRGGHDIGNEDCCLFEAVSLYKGQKKSDHPEGVSPVLNALGIGLNDAFSDTPEGDKRRTELLLPLIERLADSQGSSDLELKRQYALLDWATKERFSLRQLDPNAGRHKKDSPEECGVYCLMAERTIRDAEVA